MTTSLHDDRAPDPSWVTMFRTVGDESLVVQCRAYGDLTEDPHWAVEFFDHERELDVVPGLLVEHLMGPDHAFTRPQAEIWLERMRFRTSSPLTDWCLRNQPLRWLDEIKAGAR